jgi:hypothetical protein
MIRIVSAVLAAIACALSIALAGCVAYEPVAVAPAGSSRPAPTFENAWNAAIGAMQDAGVRVTSADAAAGVIRGARDRTEVQVTVARQAGGAIRTEVTATSPQGRETGLATRISEAYQRRMGL